MVKIGIKFESYSIEIKQNECKEADLPRKQIIFGLRSTRQEALAAPEQDRNIVDLTVRDGVDVVANITKYDGKTPQLIVGLFGTTWNTIYLEYKSKHFMKC